MSKKKQEKKMDDDFAKRVAFLMENEESSDIDNELPKRKKIGGARQ